ncbi:MAG: hypothetical protein QG620_529 [Patescibacteria group bacterium]|nr:hypothetical protein [Patescibacteria group bacterium]
MPKVKSDKRITRLEPTFADVLVCKNAKERPLLEIFTQEPENISQQNLGKIIGILEIDDQSEDSSYIVNYLISVVKKEYFSRVKRGPIESFEAALHKANLALSNLAEHGSISWIGKINAAIVVIEKNNLHISCAGSAKVLLLRLKTITDVSEKAEPEISEPNPIKTFEEVLSGRLENEDKLILATENIFNIFSLEEIKKSALKFSNSEFIRFLKTALVNELEKAAVLVVDAKEKQEERDIEKAPRKSQPINAFSQSAFSKNRPKNEDSPSIAEKKNQVVQEPLKKEDVIQEIENEVEKTGGDFVDKKTGHIYIKENSYLKEDEPLWKKRLEEARTAGSSYFFGILSLLKRTFKKITAAISAGFISAISKILSPRKSKFEPENKALFQNKNEIEINRPPIREKLPKDIFPWKAPKNFAFASAVKDIIFGVLVFIKNTSLKIIRVFANFYPGASRLKSIFLSLTTRQKIYSTVIVLAIIIAPYFIAKSEEKETNKTPAAAPEVMGAVFPLENDKNVSKVENLEEAYAGSDLAEILNVNGNILAISDKEIANITGGKKYSLPENSGTTENVCAMDDLGLAFLMDTDGKIISFSPLSGKFQDNNISLPENSDISAAGTYLTYMYLLDAKGSQIYRYPRAEGGFGERSAWLKDKVDLSAAKNMAISDTVYISNGGEIIKLFQGKKQAFQIENTATPVNIDWVYTREESSNIYILDKINSRVVQLDLEGKIIWQYYNSEIGNSIEFTIDEENNKVYFSTESSVKSFEIN